MNAIVCTCYVFYVRRQWWHQKCCNNRKALVQAAEITRGDERTEHVKPVVEAARKGSLIVHAAAGAGKTSFLVRVAKEAVGSHENVLVLTFNKNAAAELQRRGVENASTFHSFGNGLCRAALKRFQRFRLREGKTMEILKNLYPKKKNGTRRFDSRLFKHVKKLVSLLKAHAYGCNKRPALTEANVNDLASKYTIDNDLWGDGLIQSWNDFVKVCINVMHHSIKWANEDCIFDFDDMLYMPLLIKDSKNTMQMPFFDVVLVDEAQDSNPGIHVNANKCHMSDFHLALTVALTPISTS